MARCSLCGAARLGVARFCAVCGGALEEGDADDTAREPGHAQATPTVTRTLPLEVVAAPRFGVGARVLVLWANGQRYPGTVEEAAPGHCLVVFGDGQERWVATEHLTTGT